jgi:hypothetical protein
MIEYKCIECSKIFKQKIDYDRHMNRKFPCSKQGPTNQILPKNLPVPTEEKIMIIHYSSIQESRERM